MAAGEDWSESVVEVAGTKLHLARAGSGRPVLVLHGIVNLSHRAS